MSRKIYIRKISSTAGIFIERCVLLGDLESYALFGCSLGESLFRCSFKKDGEYEGNMPDWWKRPLRVHLEILFAKQDGENVQPLQKNQVRILPVTSSGLICLQRRDLCAPSGKPIDNPGYDSVHGGSIEGGETVTDALLREILEELGVHVTEDQLISAGVVYEPEQGRINYVFTLLDYDKILSSQLSKEGLLKLFFAPGEGMARTCIQGENLKALFNSDQMTGIAKMIFAELFPELVGLE